MTPISVFSTCSGMNASCSEVSISMVNSTGDVDPPGQMDVFLRFFHSVGSLQRNFQGVARSGVAPVDRAFTTKADDRLDWLGDYLP